LRGHKELPGRLLLLLGAALALPGPPLGSHPLRMTRPVAEPREEDASVGQSSPMPVSTMVSTMSIPGLTRMPTSPTGS
jgi:hypothetical protein